MATESDIPQEVFEKAAAYINVDAAALAQLALKRAAGSPDIALAVLGAAAGIIIDTIDEEHRSNVLQLYLDCFRDENDAVN